MQYCFVPANDRRVVYASHNYHINTELHPSRILKDHDIFYVIDGYCSVRLEDEELQINPGEIAVLPANHPHYGSRYYRANTHTIFIHFAFRKGDHKLEEHETPPENAILVNSRVHAINPALFQYFQDLERTYWSEMPHRELRCSAIMGLLLMEMHNCNMNEGIKRDPLILGIVAHMAEHPHRFYEIAELANEAGLSPKSLTSRFKAETGQTIHQYQLNKKLNQIAAMLRSESSAKLKSLAENFGFYDEFHLSASFKKKFGISPHQFSRNLEYAFDPSISGSDAFYDSVLQSSSIAHIANDNIQLISVKKLDQEGEMIRILLQLREFKKIESKAELLLNVTADAAFLSDANGIMQSNACVLSNDGRILSFQMRPLDSVTVALEIEKRKNRPGLFFSGG